MDGNVKKFIGKKIIAVDVTTEEVILKFEGGRALKICDAGQSCCESRYITCDDDPQTLIGGRLANIEARPGPDLSGGDAPRKSDDEHETCFVEVTTDAGFITLTTHNEHNGYYGGFSLEAKEI